MSERKQLHILYAVIAFLLVCLVSLTYVYAKYVREVPLEGNVVISGQLAQSMELYESTAHRNSDGTYTLVTPAVTAPATQEYILMPGVDVPKDPQILITGKTAIPGYLFVEVVETGSKNKVNWSMDSVHWLAVTGPTAEHGGNLYVYSADGTNPLSLTTATCPEDPIGIIAGNMLDVKPDYSLSSSPYTMTFYAALVQNVGSPAESYEAYFTPAP